jgi:hypothetical protein
VNKDAQIKTIVLGVRRHYTLHLGRIVDRKYFLQMSEHNKLNPTNPDHITYAHPPLEIAVLGGVRTDILDRMRATLKIQLEHLSLRHNLDL